MNIFHNECTGTYLFSKFICLPEILTKLYYTSEVIRDWTTFTEPPLQLGMWWSSHSHSTTCKLRTFSAHSTFDEYFKDLCVECKFVESPCSKTDFMS